MGEKLKDFRSREKRSGLEGVIGKLCDILCIASSKANCCFPCVSISFCSKYLHEAGFKASLGMEKTDNLMSLGKSKCEVPGNRMKLAGWFVKNILTMTVI